MQRYGMEEFERYPEMEEQDNGEWVKHDDVVKYIASLEPKALEVSSVECNCVEMADQKPAMLENARNTLTPNEMYFLDLSWICPAHGYKKL